MVQISVWINLRGEIESQNLALNERLDLLSKYVQIIDSLTTRS